jgi:hypothetical protein
MMEKADGYNHVCEGKPNDGRCRASEAPNLGC